MSLDVRFRSLPKWTGAPTKDRRTLPGNQTYPQVLDRLESELTKLKAINIVIETGHDARDIRLDGFVRSNARVPAHPGVVLYLEAGVMRGGKRVGDLRFQCDTYRDWQDNLRAIVLTLEDLHKIEQRGATQSGEQYRGYAALPPSPNIDDIRFRAAQLIARESVNGYLDDAWYKTTARAILRESPLDDNNQAFFRDAKKNTHPDNGGSSERFIAVQNAIQTLTAKENANAHS